MVADTNIMTLVKRKLDTDTSDQTKIQKKASSKIGRKRNENTTLLENLETKVVSSSQAEVEFCQKEYEQRQVVEEEDGKQEEVEKQGKINKAQEEEGENTEVEVVAQQEKINEVHEEEQELHEEFNASGEDGIKIINADTFPVQLQPDTNGDNIIKSVLGRPFIKFRDILKEINWKIFSEITILVIFLSPLGEKTSNLFGFPWAFMVKLNVFNLFILY